MKFSGPLLTVRDINVSRRFFEEVLGQTVLFDFGENIQFEGGFSLHEREHFAHLTGTEPSCQSSGEFYFEEHEFDAFADRLTANRDIRLLHPVVTHPWGQRVVRFYDPDGHLIEVGEPIECVIERCLRDGMSIAETVALTQLPEEYVKTIAETIKGCSP